MKKIYQCLVFSIGAALLPMDGVYCTGYIPEDSTTSNETIDASFINDFKNRIKSQVEANELKISKDAWFEIAKLSETFIEGREPILGTTREKFKKALLKIFDEYDLDSSDREAILQQLDFVKSGRRFRSIAKTNRRNSSSENHTESSPLDPNFKER